jgi:hypothetical protein
MVRFPIFSFFHLQYKKDKGVLKMLRGLAQISVFIIVVHTFIQHKYYEGVSIPLWINIMIIVGAFTGRQFTKKNSVAK